jgi:hypothetical protein
MKFLRIICKENNITGYSKFNKPKLIKYIKTHDISNIDEIINEKLKVLPIKSTTTKKYDNNEQFGITCEYVLCSLYQLDNNLENRITTSNIIKLTDLDFILTNYLILSMNYNF